MSSTIIDLCPPAIRRQADHISDYWAKQGGAVEMKIIPANSLGYVKGQGIGNMWLIRSDMLAGWPRRWFK